MNPETAERYASRARATRRLTAREAERLERAAECRAISPDPCGNPYLAEMPMCRGCPAGKARHLYGHPVLCEGDCKACDPEVVEICRR